MIRVTVRQASKARGVKTQAELARLMGVKDAVASRLWKGGHNATLDTIDAVCNALGCELRDVLVYVRRKGTRLPARKSSGTNGLG